MGHCNPPSPRKPPQYDQQLQLAAPATASITPDNVANPVEACGYNDDHESEDKELASDNAFHVEENEYRAEVDEEDGYHEEQEDATAESDFRRALHLSTTRCDQQRQAEKDEEPAASSNNTRPDAAKVDDGDDDGNKKNTNKLRIKVRGPKSEALEEAEYVGGGSSAASVEKHNCELCNRPFSSSKALGGHMRIHMAKKNVCSSKSLFLLGDDDDDDSRQTKKQIASGKYRGKNHNDGNIQADVRDNYVKNGIPTCYLCNKSFESDKSLFGHMRCHPERQWRGMIPPPSFTTASSNPNNTSSSPKASAKNGADGANHNMVSISDQQQEAVAVAVDLLQSIPGWPLTGKRGQGHGRPSGTTSIPYSASYSNTVHDFSIIARNLVPLADHDNNDNGQLNTLYQAAIAVELQISNYGYEQKGNQGDDSDTDSDDGDNDDDANSTLGKKGQDATPSSDTSLRYTCNTCHRSFHSHQALGGHRSSNHKPLRVHDNNNNNSNGNKAADEEEELEEGEIREEAEIQTAEASTSNHIYRCKICDECFPSGQALGGHQRRHWTGPTVENRVDNLRGTQQFVFPIDLNVPPQDDADDAS